MSERRWRAIAAIIAAVEGPNPPHRLLLGNQTYDGTMAKLAGLKQGFEAWETVNRGADFPADQAA